MRGNAPRYLSILLPAGGSDNNYLLQQVVEIIGRSHKDEFPNIKSNLHRGIEKILKGVVNLTGDKSASTYEVKSLFRTRSKAAGQVLFIPKKLVPLLTVIVDLLHSCTEAKSRSRDYLDTNSFSDIDCRSLLIRFHDNIIKQYCEVILSWEKANNKDFHSQDFKRELFKIHAELNEKFNKPCLQ